MHHSDSLLAGPDRTVEPVVLASLDELGPVFDRHPVPALVVDHASLALRAVNDAAVRHYGWPREEFLRLTALDVRPEEDVPAFLALVERGLGGEWPLGASGTWRHRRSDGSVRQVVTAATPAIVAGRPCSIVYVHDVTDPIRRARQDADAALGRLHAIQSVTDAALARLGFEDLVHEMLSRVCASLGSDVALLHLAEPEGGSFHVEAAHGLPEAITTSLHLRSGEGLAGPITAGENARIVRDVDRTEVAPAIRGRVRSCMAAPLTAGGEVLGVVEVGSVVTRDYTADDLSILVLVAERMALAMAGARRFDDVVDGRERLQELSRQLVGSQEAERRAIAREMHDEIGQLVTALRLMLDVARGTAAAERAPLDAEMSQLVTELSQRVRDLCVSLRPALLDEMGLMPALEAMAERFGAQAQLLVRLRAANVPDFLPDEVEVVAFRIVQEALTNIARHAGVGEAFVLVQGRGDRLELHVRDSGAGFDPAVPASLSSSGVRGMMERARLLGGRLAVSSRPAGGTSVDAWLPIGGTPDPVAA